MMYVCLWSPAWSTAGASGGERDPAAGPGLRAEIPGDADDPDRGPAGVVTCLAPLAPRLRAEREVIWVDGRGLDAARLAERCVAGLAEAGVAARAGVAEVPVAAELAARWGAPASEGEGPTPFLVKERTGWGWRRNRGPQPVPGGDGARGGGGADPAADPGAGDRVVVVVEGGARAWLAGLPVSALSPSDRLRTLLEGVGVRTLGALAELEREAVEVRLGAAAVELWRLARADDRRLLFDRIPPERPHGSLEFVDYVLTDPSRLLFTANALLGPLCDGMATRGEHARALRLTFPLANGETWSRTIRPARPTASRETWLRLIREILDHLTVPDAVAGMRIEVGDTEEAAVRQGDLFDRGFATAAAVEAAVARLAERQVHPLAPETTAHPRIERRGGWVRRDLSSAPATLGEGEREAGTHEGTGGAESPGDRRTSALSLHLLPSPRRVAVETTRRRDHDVPVRIRDTRGWREVAVAAGPDRISGGQWEGASYAREYYRCVTEEGVPLWVYRDALEDGWYLHGWWD